MNHKIIVLTDKINLGDGTVKLIAECNLVDDNGNLIQQYSRSPFVFSESSTDEEIITSLQENQYKIYFE